MPWDSDFDVKLYTEADITMEGRIQTAAYKGPKSLPRLFLEVPFLPVDYTPKPYWPDRRLQV